ncbi:MAG: RloB domain-containing protein [Candidatus Magasanikbacteria bacterium]|jgi:hypothetical protein
MSRTNPYKLKRRQANKTLLIFGEGLGEEMFLKYLKGLYSQDCNVAITIRKGKGGDAKNIVVDASKILGAFDRKVVILDNDKTLGEMQNARQEAKKRKIELIENTPCLEFLLLSILGQCPKTNSDDCKREFESKYISKQKRCELGEYQKLFSKDVLENKRGGIATLNKIITIMEGK